MEEIWRLETPDDLEQSGSAQVGTRTAIKQARARAQVGNPVGMDWEGEVGPGPVSRRSRGKERKERKEPGAHGTVPLSPCPIHPTDLRHITVQASRR